MVIGGVLHVVGVGQWLVLGTLPPLVAYLVLAWSPVMRPFSHTRIRNDPANGHQAGAIVVLSSGVTTDTTLDQQGADRLLTGLELLRSGRAPLIITTRVRRDFPASLTLWSDADQRRLISLAGAERLWLQTASVGSTREEAIRAAELLLPMRIHRIVVVTSPMHTRRACATFESAGFSVQCVAARERTVPVRNPQTVTERLTGSKRYLYERNATMKYRAAGWIN
jgi:uncharacterized SAM-binding protein YcdF (DUF218 family)